MNAPEVNNEVPGYINSLFAHREELFRERQEDDINMVEVVTEAFREAGHPEPDAWLKKDVHESNYVSLLLVAPPIRQRDLVNRIFRLLLSAYPQETLEARYCLVNSGDVQDWLAGVKKIVIPDLMRLRLV